MRYPPSWPLAHHQTELANDGLTLFLSLCCQFPYDQVKAILALRFFTRQTIPSYNLGFPGSFGFRIPACGARFSPPLKPHLYVFPQESQHEYRGSLVKIFFALFYKIQYPYHTVHHHCEYLCCRFTQTHGKISAHTPMELLVKIPLFLLLPN